MKVLETPRLVLRRMTWDDADHLLGIFSDPEAMRHYPGTKDRRETEDWIARTLRGYAREGIGLWVAERKDSGQFAGQCGLVVQEVEGRREVELGYLFLRQLWGQGFATEAAQACRDYGFNSLGYRRLISLIAPANVASQRVAEKVGMRFEQEIEKWGRTLHVYAIDSPSSTTAPSS